MLSFIYYLVKKYNFTLFSFFLIAQSKYFGVLICFLCYWLSKRSALFLNHQIISKMLIPFSFLLQSSIQSLKSSSWRASLIASPDGGPSVSPQVPAQAPCGGSKRGWDRRHEPTRKSPDFHLHRDAIHRSHSLPEHRRTAALYSTQHRKMSKDTSVFSREANSVLCWKKRHFDLLLTFFYFIFKIHLEIERVWDLNIVLVKKPQRYLRFLNY